MARIHELRRALFSPGEVSITLEAYVRIKDAGLEPQQLIERHTRGDWSGGPVKWIEKNHLRFQGVKEYPVMSVYQLHPSEDRVCVGTEADFSKTYVSNWPDGDHHAPLLPLKQAEAIYERQKLELSNSASARERVMNRLDRLAQPSKSKTNDRPKSRGKDIDLSR